jgi:hypothetical protein
MLMHNFYLALERETGFLAGMAQTKMPEIFGAHPAFFYSSACGPMSLVVFLLLLLCATAGSGSIAAYSLGGNVSSFASWRLQPCAQLVHQPPSCDNVCSTTASHLSMGSAFF